MWDDMLKRMAAAMWKAEAVRAAPNVGRKRDVTAFDAESEDTKRKWIWLAEAAAREIGLSPTERAEAAAPSPFKPEPSKSRCAN